MVNCRFCAFSHSKKFGKQYLGSRNLGGLERCEGESGSRPSVDLSGLRLPARSGAGTAVPADAPPAPRIWTIIRAPPPSSVTSCRTLDPGPLLPAVALSGFPLAWAPSLAVSFAASARLPPPPA